jgi:hypothetical protein
LVLSAECMFVVLVIAATGAAPAFVVTVLFGLLLAAAMEVQAAHSPGPDA